MVYHWLRVQMLSGMEFPKYEQKNLSHRRYHDNQEEEQRLRTMVNKCVLCVSGGNEHKDHNHHRQESGCCRIPVTRIASSVSR